MWSEGGRDSNQVDIHIKDIFFAERNERRWTVGDARNALSAAQPASVSFLLHMWPVLTTIHYSIDSLPSTTRITTLQLVVCLSLFRSFVAEHLFSNYVPLNDPPWQWHCPLTPVCILKVRLLSSQPCHHVLLQSTLEICYTSSFVSRLSYLSGSFLSFGQCCLGGIFPRRPLPRRATVCMPVPPLSDALA